MPETEKCRSCGAPVLWVRTAATGSLMPLDAEPVSQGNVYMNGDGKAVILAGGLFDEERLVRPHYQSHFVACPFAARHRRKKT